MTTPTDAELMKAAVQHSHELYKLPTSRAAFQAGVLFASQTLAKWGQPQAVAGGEPVDRVFIVATGEEHEGEATYTRYDHAPPPLCDSECLYTAPQPAVAAGWMEERENLRKALQFYADGEHFIKSDDSAWDTVSGEPQNYWCDEAGTATVEDGSIARLALEGRPIRFEDDDSAPCSIY